MLVLTRRSEESIIIGGNIQVTVLSVEGEKVKIGIDAPREVTILRKELIDAMHQQDRAAEKLVSMPETPALRNLREMLDRETENSEPEGVTGTD